MKGLVLVAAVASLALIALWGGGGSESRLLRADGPRGSVELLNEELRSQGASKAHAAHQAHRSNRYAEELASVERTGAKERKEALRSLQALKNKAGRSHGKNGEPAAVAEMENLAKRRAHTANGASGIGALARQHGIKSSKDMLAEIMSLRHYKKNNAEISDIANGFESHGSFSNKVRSSISNGEKGKEEQAAAEARKKGAAALRLEAGRFTRRQMAQKTEAETETNLAHALLGSISPIQKLLSKDEVSLDHMLSKKRQIAERNHAADHAYHHLKREMDQDLRKEVARLVHKKEVEEEHKSLKYLTKVHAKAKAALTKVVNPDDVSAKTSGNIAGFAAKTAGGWSHSIDRFLKDTDKFMSDQWDGILSPQKAMLNPKPTKAKGQGPVASAQAAIEATQEHLEDQLKSEEAAINGGNSIVPKKLVKETLGHHASDHIPGQRGRVLRKKGMLGVPGVPGTTKINKKKNKEFRRALNSYL